MAHPYDPEKYSAGDPYYAREYAAIVVEKRKQDEAKRVQQGCPQDPYHPLADLSSPAFQSAVRQFMADHVAKKCP